MEGKNNSITTIKFGAGLFFFSLFFFCATFTRGQETAIDSAWKPIYRDTGIASYYASKFEGRRTANGERYRKKEFTAAHRTLPFGTLVKVTNPKNHKWVVVRINDRGPHRKKRIIDLSYRAAKHLGLTKGSGLAKVYIEEIPRVDSRRKE